MNRQRDDRSAPDTQIDPSEVAAEVDELEFPDEGVMGPVGEQPSEQGLDPQRVNEAGLTEASFPGGGPTMDDVTPETILPDDGARSPNEPGAGEPTDQQLSEAGVDEIGARGGLDEAELGRADPLDGKRWDGDPDEPLEPAPTVDRDFPADRNEEGKTGDER